MTNLQKYAQLHKILAEAAVYRRAVGKLEFDMQCCAPKDGMEQAVDVSACCEKGDLLPIRDWLKTHVFSIASVTTPDKWIRAITGESLNPDYFLTYLEKKFSALYKLA